MKNTLPNVPVYDGTLFVWKREGVGYVDVSALNYVPWYRLYDDAADVGFYVRSHKTGDKKLFVLEKTAKNEGEIVAWTFISDDNKVRLTIFND